MELLTESCCHTRVCLMVRAERRWSSANLGGALADVMGFRNISLRQWP